MSMTEVHDYKANCKYGLQGSIYVEFVQRTLRFHSHVAIKYSCIFLMLEAYFDIVHHYGDRTR